MTFDIVLPSVSKLAVVMSTSTWNLAPVALVVARHMEMA